MSGDYWVRIQHEGVKRDEDSEAAILFKARGILADGTPTDEVWLPRSQIQEHDDEEAVIPQWLADDRGLDWEYL